MKKITKIGMILIIILATIIIVCNMKKKTTNGNLSNMGLAVEENGTVYYNKYEKGIFSSKGGTEKQLTQGPAYSMNLVDDKIYFLTVADFNNVCIKSVDISGENEKTIATIYTSISKIFVCENYIYYITNSGKNGIAKMDLNGKNEEVLVQGNIQDFYVANGEIFYINDLSKICKVSGDNNCMLSENVSAQKIQIVDNWIYYYNEQENALFRLDKKGKKNELVSVLVKNEMYNVTSEYVYYFDKENSQIARMKIGNTTKCDNIVNINTTKTKINIAGQEMYYLDKSQDEAQTYQMYRIKINGKEATKIEY